MHLLGFLGGKTQFLGTCLEVLFPLRFPLEHLGDRRLLVGLNDGEARADFEQRRRAVRCARGDESALVLDAQGVQRDICDLKSKCGVVLLEKVVPNVECAIHLCSEENTWPRWAPAAVSQVRRVVLGSHLHDTVVRSVVFVSLVSLPMTYMCSLVRSVVFVSFKLTNPTLRTTVPEMLQ